LEAGNRKKTYFIYTQMRAPNVVYMEERLKPLKKNQVMKKSAITIVLSLVMILSSIMRGAVIPALTLERGGWSGYTIGGGNRTHGWEFTVNEDLEVVLV